MSNSVARRLAEVVTTHHWLVVLVMLVVTAGVVAGVGQLEAQREGSVDEIDPDSEVAQARDYIEEHYNGVSDDGNTALSSVYVRDEGGNVLEREALLEALEYQREARADPTLGGTLAEEPTGPPNLVATAIASDPGANIDEQIAALEGASDEEVAATVAEVLEGEAASAYLPAGYEPGSASAESMRMVFAFEAEGTSQQGGSAPPEDAQQVLFDAADDRPGYFTLGPFAQQSYAERQLLDTAWLILPAALALVVGVLAFAYRDAADVAIGFVGVVVSVAWMFGLLGWLGIPAGMTMIIGPVLIVALSIDFGLHVFMRYRERRGPGDGIRKAMEGSTASVTVAFLLVTVTAAIGFLANLANPLSVIRELGVGITLGVVSAFVVFTTLVPALKVGVDGLLERVGFDRRKAALGEGRLLRPVLNAGVDAARTAAPAVVVVAVLVGAAGGVAYAEIDKQGFQHDFEVKEWQTDLPGPMAWEAHETDYRRNQQYVQAEFRSERDAYGTTRFLIEGDVTDPAALERAAAGTEAAADNEFVFTQGGEAWVLSPLSLMHAVAAEDEAFAATLEDTDADGDGVPDGNVEGVYDALYEAAPDRAPEVIERTDGEYRSLLLVVPAEQTPDPGDRGEAMHDLADSIEGDSGLSVTPVGTATIQNAEMSALADDILTTMVVALAAVLVALATVFRIQHGSLALGALTVVPITLVVGMVFGGMYLLGQPLTLLTALLVSITIGLGIDYSIHVSDRFAQELERGHELTAALRLAATGTGGALLGSALTSGSAVATLLLHPHPQFESFGTIVVLALALSFLVSVFVLPSLLYLWARRAAVGAAVGPPASAAEGD